MHFTKIAISGKQIIYISLFRDYFTKRCLLKIWILGAGGLLGRALIDRCQVEHLAFVASKREEVDIRDLDQLRKKAEELRPTHIINCAAFTNVDLAEKEARQAYSVNADGAENIAIVANDIGARLIHLSTDYVFDGTKGSPYTEEDQPNPLGVYGKSKWEGEKRVFERCKEACIVRTSWIFGFEGTNFISSLLSKMQQESSLKVVGDQMGRATYNRDLAGVLINLLCHSGLYHFANEGPVSRYKIAMDFLKEAKDRKIPIRCSEITPVSSRDFPSLSPRPSYSVLSTGKIARTLGRKPRLWETILMEYFDHVSPRH